MATQDDFDFESFKRDALAGLYAGKKMTGTYGGAFGDWHTQQNEK